MKLATKPPELNLFALVRDSKGRPVIDDGESLAPELFALLTEPEKEELKNGRYAFKRT